ncbi:MAG: MerR family DNA-binding transcriptional regulator, partial [Caldimonas sp.]
MGEAERSRRRTWSSRRRSNQALETLWLVQGQVERASMKIGELASQAGCDVQTVRFYEREGLLAEHVLSELRIGRHHAR